MTLRLCEYGKGKFRWCVKYSQQPFRLITRRCHKGCAKGRLDPSGAYLLASKKAQTNTGVPAMEIYKRALELWGCSRESGPLCARLRSGGKSAEVSKRLVFC